MLGFLRDAIYCQALTIVFREGFMVVALVFVLSIVPTLYMKVERRRV